MSTKTAVQLETFGLTLDNTIPLEQMIWRGNYECIHEDFTPNNFRLRLTGHREVVLFDPCGFVSSQEMIRRMKQDGFVPATLDDALAMGAQVPERQRNNPILFLGTVLPSTYRSRRVPVLDSWRFGRKLSLNWFEGEWAGNYRFAAVRES